MEVRSRITGLCESFDRKKMRVYFETYSVGNEVCGENFNSEGYMYIPMDRAREYKVGDHLILNSRVWQEK